MKVYVIIAAGGVGVRMNGGQPKQLLVLNGKSVLLHTIEAFNQALENGQIVIAVPQDYKQKFVDIVENNQLQNCSIVVGGNTRWDSVKNALATISDTEALVLVHDAARCLVSHDLIKLAKEVAEQKGNAVPVLDCTDSIRVLEGEQSSAIDRSIIKFVQTPQAFQIAQLQAAAANTDGFSYSDEASAVEAAGYFINLINGEQRNIKITNPVDLQIASFYLNQP